MWRFSICLQEFELNEEKKFMKYTVAFRLVAQMCTGFYMKSKIHIFSKLGH